MVVRSISVRDVHLKPTKQDVAMEQRVVLMVAKEQEFVVRLVQIMAEVRLVVVKVQKLLVLMDHQEHVRTVTEIQNISVIQHLLVLHMRMKPDANMDQKNVLTVVMERELVVKHVQTMAEAHLVAVKVHLLAADMEWSQLVKIAMVIRSMSVMSVQIHVVAVQHHPAVQVLRLRR